MKIDEMVAGRELDALVAEKVMGWEVRYDYCGEPERKLIPKEPTPVECWSRLPNLSTDISAANNVVEHFRNRQWTVELTGHEWYDGGSWECVLFDALNDERGRGSDIQRYEEEKRGWDEPSLPLAICRAALKAVGYEDR